MSILPLVRIWIVVSALASGAGWILSAAGQLNGRGYGGGAALAGGLIFLTRREWLRGGQRLSWLRLRKRFSRSLPLAFAGLAALVFLGGALYQPSNYDALTYRVPRVLHWLAEGHWHWIHTTDYRMNNRSCGFEWLMTPIFVVTQSDRALFLVNYLSFLLLPGLVFSTFVRLGVSARVAWQWMWLLPTGYNFLLQAGGLGNDAFAAVFALAAVDFALRARNSQRIADVWFSLLAAALLTGAKSGNLPLLLPWAILFVPVAPRLFSRLAESAAVILVAVLVSFVPTALINYFNCGDWTGLILEKPEIAMHHPLVGIVGNSVMFLLSNFTPTIFPIAGWWNHAFMAMLPPAIAALARANFEGGFYKLGELPIEEWAGFGFGLSCLLAASVLASWRQRSRNFNELAWPQRAVLLAPYVSLFFFFAKSGMQTVARLVSAYYPLLLPLLLRGRGPAALVRHRWWRRAAAIVLLLALVVVVVTPQRPLWPARSILSRMDHADSHPILKRMKEVYLVFADRPDSMAKVRDLMPENYSLVGFAGAIDDTEISLWRPFGHRRVEDILPGDSPEQIRARKIQYAVVGEVFLSLQHQTIETWLMQHQAVLLAPLQSR